MPAATTGFKFSIIASNRRAFSSKLSQLLPIGSKPLGATQRPTHVIVGAGTAGCVLANRLSENPTNHVHLIEAGPADDWWRLQRHIPAAHVHNRTFEFSNWYYHTLPEPNMNRRIMYCAGGRVHGGTSSFRPATFNRGHPFDYDTWANEAPGWSYAECLPYFKKAETYHVANCSQYRGSNGPIHVHKCGGKSNPLYEAFIQAGQQAGYDVSDDFNGFKPEGFGFMDTAVHEGRNCNASQSYLREVLQRPNVTYDLNVIATKLLFVKNRVIGVEMCRRKHIRTFHIRKQMIKVYTGGEVILCAGAINNAKLLMHSGIGSSHILKGALIPELMHLPGVGQNLQDHLEVSVQHKCSKPISLCEKLSMRRPVQFGQVLAQWIFGRSGPGASDLIDVGAFLRSDNQQTHPNLKLSLMPLIVSDEHASDWPAFHGFQINVCLLQPSSRGFVKVSSREPYKVPAIIFNYMTSEYDKYAMRQGVKVAREILAQESFKMFSAGELEPGLAISNDDSGLDNFIRKKAMSTFNPSGTCKMGLIDKDPEAVVDPGNFIVHGTPNLRIVDASIIPSKIGATMNAVLAMMAEKAADVIQGKQTLQPEHYDVEDGSGSGADFEEQRISAKV